MSHDQVLNTAANIFNLVEASNCNIYWKDKAGRYLDINPGFTKTLGPKPGDIRGCVDKDLRWGMQSQSLQENDQKVMYGNQSQFFVETCLCSDNIIRDFISIKSPLLNSRGAVIGIFGVSYLKNLSIVPFEFNTSSELKVGIPTLTTISQQFTARQLDCLYYLVQGMTAKQIAKELSLSHRTVEHYLVALRKKLKCTSRAELINCALQITEIKQRIL